MTDTSGLRHTHFAFLVFHSIRSAGGAQPPLQFTSTFHPAILDSAMPNPPMNRHAILLTTDLMSLSPFSFAAQTAGGSLEAAASLEQLNTKLAQRLPSVVLIDLTLSRLDLEQAVAAVRNASIPADGSAGPISIIAYGPHVHEGRLEAARQAGCDLVLTRGQAHRGLAELLRQTWGCSQ